MKFKFTIFYYKINLINMYHYSPPIFLDMIFIKSYLKKKTILKFKLKYTKTIYNKDKKNISNL